MSKNTSKNPDPKNLNSFTSMEKSGFIKSLHQKLQEVKCSSFERYQPDGLNLILFI